MPRVERVEGSSLIQEECQSCMRSEEEAREQNNTSPFGLLPRSVIEQ